MIGFYYSRDSGHNVNNRIDYDVADYGDDGTVIEFFDPTSGNGEILRVVMTPSQRTEFLKFFQPKRYAIRTTPEIHRNPGTNRIELVVRTKHMTDKGLKEAKDAVYDHTDIAVFDTKAEAYDALAKHFYSTRYSGPRSESVPPVPASFMTVVEV